MYGEYLKDYDLIEIIDGGGGYDWTEGRLIKRKNDGQLLFVVQSGCSCNDWEMGFFSLTQADLKASEVPSWQEAVEVAKRVAMDNPYSGWNSETVYAFADRLNKERV